MSGPPQNKLPRGILPRQPSSPIHYRPPSPWTVASPPPIISGPPSARSGVNSPSIRYGPNPSPLSRSNQNSPMFGASGLRGTRGTPLPCPRPQWPNAQGDIQYAPPEPMYQPPPIFQRSDSLSSPTPKPYIPTGAMISPVEYLRRTSIDAQNHYEHPPLPNPKSYVIYDDEDQGGLSTAEIIANQSQDYIDEKLAEYQLTITQLQEEQERVQKKTFVNWINSYLLKRIPPLKVIDLIEDLKDGTKLIALLEILSGEKLPIEKGRILRRPHFLSNANTALQFLASKRIKLVNINPADLVDGRPAVVLGLIWTIILYFQIEENSRALAYLDHNRFGGSTSSIDSSSATTVTDLKAEKWKQGARRTLLQWVTNALPKNSGVEIRDFGASWRDGVAFLALIDGIKANLVNLVELRNNNTNRQRLETAFDVAEEKLGITRLLDPEDVDVEKPDEKSIMTYVAQFLQKYPEPQGNDSRTSFKDEYDQFYEWLRSKISICDGMFKSNTFPNEYSKYLLLKTDVDIKREFYNKLKKLNEMPNKITQFSFEEINEMWQRLNFYLNYWLWLLDSRLHGEFGVIGKWLAEAEKLLQDNEIPNVMNEETASIISNKLEEHKQFFVSTVSVVERFENALKTESRSGIPENQLINMQNRLYEIPQRAAKRRIFLKFCEHKCCLIAFLNLIETKLSGWTVKYGHQQDVEQLIEQYKNFIQRNKVFQEFNKAFIDMQQVVEEYKRDGDISKHEEISITRFLKETEDRWKHVSTELRCVQNMMDEVVASWKRWNQNYAEFINWLEQAKACLKKSEDDKLEFFQDISTWKEKFTILNDAGSLLVATCRPDISNDIKHKLTHLTEQWESVFAITKQYMFSGDLLRNRNEFKQGLARLQTWLTNSENILSTQSTFVNAEKIQNFEKEIQNIQSGLEEMEELFRTISKRFQQLIQDFSRDDVNEHMNILKREKERLVRIRSAIASKSNLFKQILMQYESLESGSKEIHTWLDEAENLLSTLSLSGSRETVQSLLNNHKTFFSRSLYYKSMLDSKNKVLQNLLKSATGDASLDFSSVKDKIDQLNSRFNYVIQNSQHWENRLKDTIRCWNNYKEAEYKVADWIHRADAILSDNFADSKKSLEAQKLFFENVNDKWIQTFEVNSQELAKCLPENEAKLINEHCQKLTNKWYHCVKEGPIHLMKLEYNIEDNNFKQCLNEIENELHLEQQALNKNEDVEKILNRNENYFKSKGPVWQLETSLENMKKIGSHILQNTNDQSIINSMQQNENHLQLILNKISNVRKVLQQIPIQWQNYHKKFNEIELWMNTVDQSLQNILNNVNSMEEFEKERIVFQNICHEADSKREDMKWLVKTLDSLLPYTVENESNTEQQKLESLINRYKSLIPSIEITMTKTEVISKCYTYKKEIKDVVTLLNKVKDQTLQIPPPESLDNINQMVQEQSFAVHQLDNQRTHIMSMIQRGKDLSKDSHAPAFVNADIKALETGWNDTYNQTVEKLRNLKGIQAIWNKFNEQKSELYSIINKVETELRSITPLQTDPQNVTSDLKNKRELSHHVNSVSQEMVANLKELGSSLKPHIASGKVPKLDKEIVELEKRMFNTVEHIKDRVNYLEDYSAKWDHYKDRLCDLQNWASYTAPKLIAELDAEDLLPEEKAMKVAKLQELISQRMRELDILASDALYLAPKEGNVTEAKRLKAEVSKLQNTLTSLNKNIEKEVNVVEDQVKKWTEYTSQIGQLTPWLDSFEDNLKQINTKPMSLTDAKDALEKAQQHERECEDTLKKIIYLKQLNSSMSSKSGTVDELDTLNSKLNLAMNTVKQFSNKYDKLHENWNYLEREIDEMANWLTNMEEKVFAKDITPQIDKQQKLLVQLKSYNNEVSEQQAKLIHLTQNCDQISHSVSNTAANELRDKILELKNRMAKLSDSMRSKINEVSDSLIARHEFNSSVNGFMNWIQQFHGKADNLNIVSSNKVEPLIQQIHGLLNEHAEKVPVFNEIYTNVKNLSLNAVPDEQIILNDTYSTLASNFKSIEQNLITKKEHAIAWNDFLSWKDDTENQLNFVKKQIDKSDELIPIPAEIEQINNKLNQWKQKIDLLDNNSILEIRDSATGKSLSAFNIINKLHKDLEDLIFKMKNKQQTIQMFEEQKIQFNEIKSGLEKKLIDNQEKLNNQLLLNSDISNIMEVIDQLEALKKDIQKETNLKHKVHDEGYQLIKQDISLTIPVQECLLVLDKNWDIIQEEVDSRLNRYKVLSEALKMYNMAENKFKDDIKGIKITEIEPTNEIELNKAIENIKRTLDSIKKLKGTLEDIERKGNGVVKHLNIGNEAAFEKISNDLESNAKDWQNLFNDAAQKLHLYETEVILCKQISDNTKEIASWVEATQNSLSNSPETESIPMKLTKYENEFHPYNALKENVMKKIEELNSINPKLAQSLNKELMATVHKPLEILQQTVFDLQTSMSQHNAKESEIRKDIRNISDNIGKIRESLLACDDMSGDTNKVIERLNMSNTLKAALFKISNQIGGITNNLDHLKENYPTTDQSISQKELANVKKRHENIILYSDKIIASLTQYLNKLCNDKLTVFDRFINTQTEKASWCSPEKGSDRYNLEVKMAALTEIEKSLNEIELLKQELIAIGENDDLNHILQNFLENRDKSFEKFESLKGITKQVSEVLGNNIDLWKKYEDLTEHINGKLKDAEHLVKVEVSNQIDMANIDKKVVVLNNLKKSILSNQPKLIELKQIAKLLLEQNPEVHINQYVGLLNNRNDNMLKTLDNYCGKIEKVKYTKANYDQMMEACKSWIADTRNTQNALARFGSPAPTPAGNNLNEYKVFLKEFEVGQKMISDVSEVGEILYSDIVPSNREQIRTELRALREEFDSVFDDAKLLLKQIESILLQKTSLEESYDQVKQWLDQLKNKIYDDKKLFATLSEKKNNLHAYKSQIQDIFIQKNALGKLLDKASMLLDEDVADKVQKAINDFDEFNKTLNKQVNVCENYVATHETYDKMIEKARDWLTSLKIQAIDLLGDASFEKDGTDDKLEIIQNLLAQKPEGDAIILACAKQLETVISQTHPDGHEILNHALEEIKKSWKEFELICKNAQKKLEQLCNKWNEYDKIIETLFEWIQQKENLIRDQSLKNNLENKQLHLKRLQHEDVEIENKADEIQRIIDQGYEIEGDVELTQKVSRLSTRYQTVKNLCKESIAKYTNFVNNHQKFDKDYETFKKTLEKLLEELNANNQIVGNLNILQERYNALRILADRKINESTTFEILLDQGEKLYAQTSPDGRETIRQQLRSIRKLWDNFSEDLNSAQQKLEQCLLQFSEFNISQEQLTKWLKDVEENMQNHIELKNTLQEKQAQLQNHKLMHQEILAHNNLVDVVCDKAQSLVNQTQDLSLNAYLQSIKELFSNIVKKSEDLLVNLEHSVQAHQNLNNKINYAKEWIRSESEKLIECYDTTGEKPSLILRLQTLAMLNANAKNGEQLLADIKESYTLISKTVSNKGNELIQKEIMELQDNFNNYLNESQSIEKKLKGVLEQWESFEVDLDSITKWCRSSEKIFRDQTLQSTVEDKQKLLKKYQDEREKINAQESNIDKLVDNAHNLLNSSGIERIKVLTSQLLSRYQLLQVLSKETVNQYQSLVENHANYNEKLAETQNALKQIIAQIKSAQSDENVNSIKIDQLISELNQIDKQIQILTSLGENILPETSTIGREKIRNDLRNIREEWDAINDEIKKIEKRIHTNSLQLSSYNDLVTNTKNWLENVESTLKNENLTAWVSQQEIRSKQFKYKTLLQDITAHKRIIENINEKASLILASNPDAVDVKNTLENINSRYNIVKEQTGSILQKLDKILNFYQQFNELQKSQQDYQKKLWENLANNSDYSGHKTVLQERLNKINEIFDRLPEAEIKINNLENLIQNSNDYLSIRAKEIFVRDIQNLKLDNAKFINTLNDVKRDLESHLREWSECEGNVDRLLRNLNECEANLKNYSLKSSLGEKQEQLAKFQILNSSLKNYELELEKIIDDSAELIEKSGDTRLSVQLQQLSAQLQSIQAATKEIIKKCEQAVTDHSSYNDHYKQCADLVAMVQQKYQECDIKDNVHNLQEKSQIIQDLLNEKNVILPMMRNVTDLGEKVYPQTNIEGREHIRNDVQNLQQSVDSLFDSIASSGRLLQASLSNWSGFEENLQKITKWLSDVSKHFTDDMILKSTLDEKRTQLQTYREILNDVQNHKSDILSFKDNIGNFANKDIDKKVTDITNQYNGILTKSQSYVDKYEDIVSNHQMYSKAVMDTQEYIDATHNTINLWGDLELDLISLQTNLERMRTLRATIQDENERVQQIRYLGEKVVPGTIESGQINIKSQIDCSQQEWEGLLSAVNSTIEAIENKLDSWKEYENLRDGCILWIKNMDSSLHSIDLKSSLPQKEEQFKTIKSYQGEIRAKELEIDNVTEKAQVLYRGLPGSRNPQISELVFKYQQIFHKIKELNSRWQNYVTSHQEFISALGECRQWLSEINQKLHYCGDLTATSQSDMEEKANTIQDLLMLKDEGCARVQSIVELAQGILVNTAPPGHEDINNSIMSLQQEWSDIALKMIDVKSSLDDWSHQWSGLLEQIQQINKSIEWMTACINELSPYQSSTAEKRSQLDKIKSAEEKVRLEKIEIDPLKLKIMEMIESGQQTQGALQAKQILDKFDVLNDQIKKLLSEREAQFRDHRLYQEAHDDLSGWINRIREKLPMQQQRSLTDKFAIENSVTPLEQLMNRKPQGDLLVEHLQHTGEVVLASTSPAGKTIIRDEMKALQDTFNSIFAEIEAEKKKLEGTLFQWMDYKEEYERLSEWLKQIDIFIKNHKLSMMPNLEEKQKQVIDMKDILQRLENGGKDIEKFNKNASSLLNSQLDSYVTSQLKNLNSTYQVQVNIGKDVLKKVETNADQHKQYQDNLSKATSWIENAREIVSKCNEMGNVNKEQLQKRLDEIQNVIKNRDDGQNLVHATINLSEKILRNTRSDGKEIINNQVKELQNDWDRLVKKLSSAKVHLETNMLQWADYNSSCNQLQQWITEREAKLQQVTEQKISKGKKGQPRLSSGLNERKANLRQTNNIVQDIVLFEPMIQSVTSKASELSAAPVSEISSKYETLSKTARNLYEKQKEAVDQQQALINASNEFVQWLRNMKDILSKCSEPTGDQEALSSKIAQLKILENETDNGKEKLEKALEIGEAACKVSDANDREIIEEELGFLQEEFDKYVVLVNQTKDLLENGIVKWREYDDMYNEYVEWLNKTETIVQSFNKLQNSLSEKKYVLEQFQEHLQTLFDWQTELDKLNVHSQALLEICSDTRISNAVTQLTTKYNALLSLAKEIMRRLELYYQEHQQHSSLYEECQDWLERTRDKLNDCIEIPRSLTEIQIKMNTIKSIRQNLEQGQNKLRYLLELKEKVIMNTEVNGAIKIQEDTDALKQEYDSLLNDMNNIKQQLTVAASRYEESNKLLKMLLEWLDDVEQKLPKGDVLLTDLSEKRILLEKIKGLKRDVDSYTEITDKINTKINENPEVAPVFQDALQRFGTVKVSIDNTIEKLTNYVNIQEKYKKSYNDIYEWIRKTKIEINQCCDSHGELNDIIAELKKLESIQLTIPEGKIILENTIDFSNQVLQTTNQDGQLIVKEEINKLKADWEELLQLSKDSHESLVKCTQTWHEFNKKASEATSWIDETNKQIRMIQNNDKNTPAVVPKLNEINDEIVAKKPLIDDLSDICETLMELSACPAVRDKTVDIQVEYSKLSINIQTALSKIEKDLSDHTEFINYRAKMRDWLQSVTNVLNENSLNAKGSLEEKLNNLNSLLNKNSEGHYLFELAQDAFTKAIEMTRAEDKLPLQSEMDSLKSDWDEYNNKLSATLEGIKNGINKLEEFNDSAMKLDKWSTIVHADIGSDKNSHGDVSIMKTLLEKYKQLDTDVDLKLNEIEYLTSDAANLEGEYKITGLKENIATIHKNYQTLKSQISAKIKNINAEVSDYNDYHSNLQDIEKWLLQVSFQLMAHNSLYINSRDQTLEQIKQHENLLNTIQKYQSNIDDLKAKGQCQINRYKNENPFIKESIELQQKNIQESYNSLLHNSVQIKNRLHESFLKFQEYENILDEITRRFPEYQLILESLDEPASTVEETRGQLAKAQKLHNDLQNEKLKLAKAIQACEAATASISRPSSPLDTNAQPIPEKELMVRANLEDLIDQVQSHLTGISTTINEIESQQKVRQDLQNWIHSQNANIVQLSTQPLKLKPESIKQDINDMNDLLQIINEKRKDMALEMTGGFVDLDHSSELDNTLNGLESNIFDVIAKKRVSQEIIDKHLQNLNALNNWVNELMKQIERVEEDKGLPSDKKLKMLSTISTEFETNGPKNIALLKDNMVQLRDVISNLDAQQADEQIKGIERKFADIKKQCFRKMQILEGTLGEVDSIKNETAQINEWYDIQNEKLIEKPLDFDIIKLENRQQDLKGIIKESDSKRIHIKSLEKKADNLKNELEGEEYKNIKAEIKNIYNNHNNLNKNFKNELERIAKGIKVRKQFETDLDQLRNTLKNKNFITVNTSEYVPLLSNDIENELHQARKQDNNLNEFKEKTFNNVLKQADNILGESNDDDKAKINDKIRDVTQKYDALKEKSMENIKQLTALLQSRKQFEKDKDAFMSWLSETERQISIPIKSGNIPLLEDQSIKTKRIMEEMVEKRVPLTELNQQVQNMIPQLNAANKVKIADEMKTMKDKYNQLGNRLNEIYKEIQSHMSKYQENKSKVADCVQFINTIQTQIRELNKPVGSKIEDVQELLIVYENILKSLKDNKSQLNDMPSQYFPELENIMLQQDNMIKMIEDQLTRLKQLLHLREQFIGLVNDIITFIMKYTSIITDIEKSNESIENKIKNYDNVIQKIQECEGMLSMATDKGQQIALEGSAADQNSITEQLQSLKQQLQNLRKAVENQKQKHELILAEHKKLAQELSELIDILQSKETLIKNRPLLDRDPDSVDIELQKYRAVATDINKHLKRLDKIMSQLAYENLPSSLQETVSISKFLLSSLPAEIKEGEEYLQQNKAYRLNYMELISRFNAWIHEAEIRLQDLKLGVDFENISNNINDFKLFFDDEESIKKLFTHDIQTAVNNIYPSLKPVEQTELKSSFAHCNQQLERTLNAAHKQKKEFDDCLQMWKDYRDQYDKVKAILARISWEEEPCQNLAALQYIIQKINHMKSELQLHKKELINLNEKSKEVIKKSDQKNRKTIGKENIEINEEWNRLSQFLDEKLERCNVISGSWKYFENKLSDLENNILNLQQRYRHIDFSIKSRQQLEETKIIIEDIINDADNLRPKLHELDNLFQPVLKFLGGADNSSIQILQNKITTINTDYNNLCKELNNQLSNLNKSVNDINKYLKEIENLEHQLQIILEQSYEIDLYSGDLNETETKIQNIKTQEVNTIEKGNNLKTHLAQTFDSIPSEIAKELNNLDLFVDKVKQRIFEMDKEYKKARTIRTDYLRGVDEIQNWIHQTELRIQDRTLEPNKYKELLQNLTMELNDVRQKLDGVTQNGHIIIEKCHNNEEKILIRTTIELLAKRLEEIQLWTDDKKKQVGDTIEAWSRFMNLYKIIMDWATEKREYLAHPLQVNTLTQSRQKLQDYNNAVKSIKPMVKNLSEMDKELEQIAQVTKVGDLREKLEEAEQVKIEIEAALLERHSLLHETTEEWEQYEKKIKDVRIWIEKTTGALETLHQKKKSIRDQLAMLEKFLADIVVQKTKISLSAEKLQVHFRAGIIGNGEVIEISEKLLEDLDNLNHTIKDKNRNCEEIIGQIDVYQQQVQILRQKIAQEEQQLRHIMATPSAMIDKEKTTAEDKACKDLIKNLQAKIESRNDRIKIMLLRNMPDTDILDLKL